MPCPHTRQVTSVAFMEDKGMKRTIGKTQARDKTQVCCSGSTKTIVTLAEGQTKTRTALYRQRHNNATPTWHTGTIQQHVRVPSSSQTTWPMWHKLGPACVDTVCCWWQLFSFLHLLARHFGASLFTCGFCSAAGFVLQWISSKGTCWEVKGLMTSESKKWTCI